jgi:hypothetical protein
MTQWDTASGGLAMRTMVWAGLFVLALIAGSAGGRAADDKDKAKDNNAAEPKAAAVVPGPFRAFVVNGERKGRFRDLVTPNDLYPTVGVFARDIPKEGDPLFALLQKLQTGVTVRREAHLGAFAAFLTVEVESTSDRLAMEGEFLGEGKREALEKLVAEVDAVAKAAKLTPEVDEVNKKIRPHVTLGIDLVSSPQTKALGLDLQPGDVTVIFYDHYRIRKRWNFTKDMPLTAEAVEAVVKDIDSALAPRKKK